MNVQILSYKTEVILIGSDEIPLLKDTIDTLLQCREIFYGYFVDDELSGVISIKIENDVMDIHRLFVHPKHFRKGIAQILLDFIQVNEEGFKQIIVSTGSQNTPAIRFYQKNGFSIIKEIKVADHLSLTFFLKEICI
ncbi:GNAT family N-acetyltransferase [Bacillus sp. SD088]|uniref:GNAT family N-acetyltransferase n=1 Tax=Bacillus sp. SD088 TaxID=2782012 RepID=UPI001F606DAB|nr:GNAT family N-acetyltransferase [Bacillus sp. SD088]